MAAPKKLWALADLGREFGKSPGYFRNLLALQRTFPPPDYQLGRSYGWDPGRRGEIEAWLKERQHVKALKVKNRRESVLAHVAARQLPPVRRAQALLAQGLKEHPKLVSVPARDVRLGDVRPWGGVVNRITPPRHRRSTYIIHDYVLGAHTRAGPKTQVLIRPRPEMEAVWREEEEQHAAAREIVEAHKAAVARIGFGQSDSDGRETLRPGADGEPPAGAPVDRADTGMLGHIGEFVVGDDGVAAQLADQDGDDTVRLV